MLPDALDELSGPAHGVVRLPISLDWSEQGQYNLDDDADRRLMYERVIREAMEVNALREFLNRAVLVLIWRQLYLPARIKNAWESRFPVLAHVS
jgi:hypothetical protein